MNTNIMYMDSVYSQYIYDSLTNIGYKYNYSNVKFMLDFSFLLLTLLNDYILARPHISRQKLQVMTCCCSMW